MIVLHPRLHLQFQVVPPSRGRTAFNIYGNFSPGFGYLAWLQTPGAARL